MRPHQWSAGHTRNVFLLAGCLTLSCYELDPDLALRQARNHQHIQGCSQGVWQSRSARGSRCVYITGSFERARDSVARSNVHEPPCASSIRLPAKLGSGSLWIYALQDCDLCNQRNYSSHVCLNTMVPSTIRDAREANFTEITGGNRRVV